MTMTMMMVRMRTRTRTMSSRLAKPLHICPHQKWTILQQIMSQGHDHLQPWHTIQFSTIPYHKIRSFSFDILRSFRPTGIGNPEALWSSPAQSVCNKKDAVFCCGLVSWFWWFDWPKFLSFFVLDITKTLWGRITSPTFHGKLGTSSTQKYLFGRGCICILYIYICLCDPSLRKVTTSFRVFFFLNYRLYQISDSWRVCGFDWKNFGALSWFGMAERVNQCSRKIRGLTSTTWGSWIFMSSKSFRTQPTEAHRQNHFKAVVFVSKTGGKGSLPQTGPSFWTRVWCFQDNTPATCCNSSDAV